MDTSAAAPWVESINRRCSPTKTVSIKYLSKKTIWLGWALLVPVHTGNYWTSFKRGLLTWSYKNIAVCGLLRAAEIWRCARGGILQGGPVCPKSVPCLQPQHTPEEFFALWLKARLTTATWGQCRMCSGAAMSLVAIISLTKPWSGKGSQDP